MTSMSSVVRPFRGQVELAAMAMSATCRVISGEQVARLLPMRQAIEVNEAAFRALANGCPAHHHLGTSLPFLDLVHGAGYPSSTRE